MSFLHKFSKKAVILLGASLCWGMFYACSDTTNKVKTPCTPGKETYCRCINIEEEGTHVCGDDGESFSACLPCYSDQIEDAGDLPDRAVSQGVCGNSILEYGELCDMGNKGSDTCTTACQPVANARNAGTCPGLPLHLWGGGLELTGSTSTYSAKAHSLADCGDSTGITSKDRVYELNIHASGQLLVSSLSSTFDMLLYLRSSCAEVSTEIKCVNRSSLASVSESIGLQVNKGDTLYLYVDGGDLKTGGSQGDYKIRFDLQTSSEE